MCRESFGLQGGVSGCEFRQLELAQGKEIGGGEKASHGLGSRAH
jgi:hypothetical protein